MLKITDFRNLFFEAIFIILVITKYSSASILVAKLNIRDQYLNANPSQIIYYWSGALDTTQRMLNLDVSLQIQTSSLVQFELNPAASITIKCELTPNVNDNSYAKVTFVSSRVDLREPTTRTSINFAINNYGNSPMVRCSADLNSFQPQSVGDNLIELTQLIISPSSQIPMTIVSYPTISFDSTNINISPFSSSLTELNIRFRDKIINKPVQLTCSVLTNANLIQIDPNTKTVAIGLSLTEIKLTRNADLQPNTNIRISCNADTMDTVGVLKQYSSSIAIAQTTLTVIKPTISLGLSTFSFLSGSSFQLPLELKPISTSNRVVNIECGIRNFESPSALSNYQNSLPANVCPRTLTTTTLSTRTTTTTTTRTTSTTTTTASTNTGSSSSSPTTQQITTTQTSTKLTTLPKTFDKQKFDWYFIDSGNSSFLVNKIFDSKTTIHYLRIQRVPMNQLRYNSLAFLSIICCDTSNTVSSISYANQFLQVFLEAPSNLDLSVVSKRSIPSNIDLMDPAYIPCSCDLTIDMCDLECCCDRDCTTADQIIFKDPCRLTTRPVFDLTVNEWYCNDIYGRPKLIKPDWFPIMCIHSNLTALLGSYYSPQSLEDFQNNNAAFQSTLDQAFLASYNTRSRYLNDPISVGLDSTQLISSSVKCDLNSNNQYVDGSCILITTSDTSSIKTDFLRFPQSQASSSCFYGAPLKYLSSPRKTFCSIRVDQNTCQTNKYLDVNQFNLKDNVFVFKNPSLNTDKATVLVEYYKCPRYNSFFTDSSINGQPSTIACGPACEFDSTKSLLFDGNTNGNICNNDFWSYLFDRLPSSIPNDFYGSYDIFDNSALCEKITENDAISRKPSYLAANQVCSNVVSSVKYVLFWENANINKILVRIVLSDVSLADPSTKDLNQLYEYSWFYDLQSITAPLVSMKDYNVYISSENAIRNQRSGIQGFQIGQPVISGYKADASDTSTNVNTAFVNRISTYSILNGKYCGTVSNLERKPILYGVNITSNCMVRLTKADLDSRCLCLRRIIFNKLNDYFAPSSHVSVDGNPNMDKFDADDWVHIYPQDRSLTERLIDIELSKCHRVPYKLTIMFFTKQNGKVDGILQNQIIASYISYSYMDWSFVCNSNRDDCLTQDFKLEFEAKFIDLNKRNITWLQKCQEDPSHSEACIELALYTWPTDYRDRNYFYLYTVQLGLIFGVISLIIVYVMLFGFVCPC